MQLDIGKREGRSPLMASAAGHDNGLLFLNDTVSKRRFLIDTGAEVSVLPATGMDTRTKIPGPPLLAANGSSIRTYGTHTLSIHLPSNTYQWTFLLADITPPAVRCRLSACKLTLGRP